VETVSPRMLCTMAQDGYNRGILKENEVSPMSDSNKHTAVITVVGQDRVGIIARVATELAALSVNINDISQTILQDVFTMIMLVDYSTMPIDIKELGSRMEALGDEMGLAIRVQHSDIFKAMHRV